MCPKQKVCEDSRHERGFSIIEIVISMLVMTVIFGGLIGMLTDYSVKGAMDQTRRTAMSAAKELMEEVKSKRFDQLGVQDPVSGWSTIGVDTGETAGDKSTFNDVDDYNGFSENLAAPFSGLTRSVAVTYVSDDDLTTASASSMNDYKRITVQVADGNTTYASLVTVVCSVVKQT